MIILIRGSSPPSHRHCRGPPPTSKITRPKRTLPSKPSRDPVPVLRHSYFDRKGSIAWLYPISLRRTTEAASSSMDDSPDVGNQAGISTFEASSRYRGVPMTWIILIALLLIAAVAGRTLLYVALGYADYLIEQRRQKGLIRRAMRRRDGRN